MEPNKCTPSTTWEWRKVKIQRRSQSPSSASPQGASHALRADWNPREPLTVTVRYRGGPEAWIELKARGETYRMPGHVALFDALSSVWSSRSSPSS